jgi:hypothetical protein
MGNSGGHAPQTPLSRLRRASGMYQRFCEAELTLLLLFWKRRAQAAQCMGNSGGHAPQTPLSRLRRASGMYQRFCEAELTLLLLFWKRRAQAAQCMGNSGGTAPGSAGGLAVGYLMYGAKAKRIGHPITQ